MPDEIGVLRALAHPVRWGILERLAAEPGICACDFTEFFEVSQPTISAHLKTRREAGLVTAQRRGTTICYRLSRDQLAKLVDRLGGMAAVSLNLNAEPIGRRHNRSLADGKVADRKARRVVHPENFLDRKAIKKPVLNHGAAAPSSFRSFSSGCRITNSSPRSPAWSCRPDHRERTAWPASPPPVHRCQ